MRRSAATALASDLAEAASAAALSENSAVVGDSASSSMKRSGWLSSATSSATWEPTNWTRTPHWSVQK